MVREGIAGEEAFPFYEKAVLRGIRITRLYEFYMASIKKDIKVRIQELSFCILHMIQVLIMNGSPSYMPMLSIIKHSIRIYMIRTSR